MKISFLHQKERDSYKNKVAEYSTRTNTTTGFLEAVQPAYFTWGKVYTTPLIWATEVSESSQITSRERALQRDYELALVEAAGEHEKLMKKLKLGKGKAQELLSRAITSVSRGEP